MNPQIATLCKERVELRKRLPDSDFGSELVAAVESWLKTSPKPQGLFQNSDGNQHGEQSKVVDGVVRSAEVSELVDAYPYGTLRINEQNGSNEQRKGISGHEYDSATSLTYANSRYYNGANGKFISQDPAFINLTHLNVQLADPQSWNSYAYARNNPLVLVDPYGNMWMPWQSSGGVSNWMGNGGFLYNVYGSNVNSITTTAQNIQQNGWTSDNIMALGADAASITAKTSNVISLGLAPVAATKITAEHALRASVGGGLSMSTTYLNAKVEGRDVSWKEYAWSGVTGAGSGLISNRGWLASGVYAGGSNAAGQFFFRTGNSVDLSSVAISSVTSTIGLKGTPTVYKFITEQVMVWNAETAGQVMYSGATKSQDEKKQEGGDK